MNNLTKSERDLLNYYLNNYNAKWMQVFSNKHPIFETNVVFYSIFKINLYLAKEHVMVCLEV